ncbi:hypothetical protein [Bacillus alkalicellulosilyticus]|uniref:hypothetical protein n=1 Tax=Alkalihalobacterium alkalicellulosilyticum TaxID=1912214 RepID=UPI000997DDB7|nr:hypothetical protein [Bacillus alkalicellulosilyticus]
MKKFLQSENSTYDNQLKKLDSVLMENRNSESKNDVYTKLYINMNKQDNKMKKESNTKYIFSIAAFLLILFIGVHSFSFIEFGQDVRGDGVVEDVQNQNSEHMVTSNRKVIILNNGEDLNINDFDLRLPSVLPFKISPTMRKIENNGLVTVETRYETNETLILIEQAKLHVPEKEAQHKIENDKYKESEVKQFTIQGYPAYLVSERYVIHVITNKYVFSINVRGLNEEQLIEIANTIDLEGL